LAPGLLCLPAARRFRCAREVRRHSQEPRRTHGARARMDRAEGRGARYRPLGRRHDRDPGDLGANRRRRKAIRQGTSVPIATAHTGHIRKALASRVRAGRPKAGTPLKWIKTMSDQTRADQRSLDLAKVSTLTATAIAVADMIGIGVFTSL